MLTSSGTKQVQGGYHDDGEPRKSAGWPIFLLIEQFNLTNLCVLVVRYYGGIKLGSGGLVRAYHQSTKALIDQFVFKAIEDVYQYLLEFDHRVIKIVDRFCFQNQVKVVNKTFDNQVHYDIIASKPLNFTQFPVKVLNKQKTEIR